MFRPGPSSSRPAAGLIPRAGAKREACRRSTHSRWCWWLVGGVAEARIVKCDYINSNVSHFNSSHQSPNKVYDCRHHSPTPVQIHKNPADHRALRALHAGLSLAKFRLYKCVENANNCPKICKNPLYSNLFGRFLCQNLLIYTFLWTTIFNNYRPTSQLSRQVPAKLAGPPCKLRLHTPPAECCR